MAFYYAKTDENRVLCVDQLDPDNGPWTPERVASMAKDFPNVIYFQIGRYFCLTYACGSCNGCREAGQPEDTAKKPTPRLPFGEFVAELQVWAERMGVEVHRLAATEDE